MYYVEVVRSKVMPEKVLNLSQAIGQFERDVRDYNLDINSFFTCIIMFTVIKGKAEVYPGFQRERCSLLTLLTTS